MNPILLHIYGPLNINAYGFWIACGVLIFTWLSWNDSRTQKLISYPDYINTIMIGILSGIIGGRLFCLISNPSQFRSIAKFFALYKGGFSILGAVVGILLGVSAFLYYKKARIIQMFDIFGTYGGLLQAISRIGCFFAGCCYGIPSRLPWAVRYTHPDSHALIGIKLHPVQLYSSVMLLSIFAFMYALSNRIKRPGIIISLYLLCISIERFSLDFFRANRSSSPINGLSSEQLIALSLAVVSIGLLAWFSYKTPPAQPAASRAGDDRKQSA